MKGYLCFLGLFLSGCGVAEKQDLCLTRDQGICPALANTIYPEKSPQMALLRPTPDAIDFGGVNVGESSQKIVTITNAGGAPATLVQIIQPDSVSSIIPFIDFKSSTTCAVGQVLQPKASCKATITFAPTQAQVALSALSILYNDGEKVREATAIIRALGQGSTGTGTETGSETGTVSISNGPVYDFGYVLVDSTASKVFTLTNGTATAVILGTVDTSSLGISSPFAFAGGTCESNQVLLPGEQCTLEITCSSGSPVGAAGTLSVTYFTGLIPQKASLAIQGNIVPDGEVAIYGDPFGNVPANTTSAQEFIVMNQGQLPVTLGAIGTQELALTNGFRVIGGTCLSGQTLASFETCLLEISFTPRNARTYKSTLALPYTNESGVHPALQDLSGTGI